MKLRLQAVLLSYILLNLNVIYTLTACTDNEQFDKLCGEPLNVLRERLHDKEQLIETLQRTIALHESNTANINELLAVKRQQLAELRERATQQQNTQQQNNNCTKCERELAHRVHQLQAQQLKPCELPTTTNVPPSRNASDLLYDNELAGPGWIVIQQRINGLENFNRSWQDYRNGFGTFEGDFFLGLEHIYRLTNAQRHELYIHMERFNGSTYFARYSDFRISRERDEYRLQELGDMTGTAADKLTYHKYQQFSTYDRDTDSGGCAKKYYGGWWYKGHNWHCSFSNLNGKYFQSEKESNLAVYWGQEFSLLTVKMLIRPFGK